MNGNPTDDPAPEPGAPGATEFLPPESPPTDPPMPEPVPPWPLWQRIAFRFLLVYYVLYAFPRPLSNLLQSAAGTIGFVAEAVAGDQPHEWLRHGPLAWPGKWSRELAKVEDGRQAVTTWLDQHHLAPYEVIHQRTGSGDTAHDIAMLLATLAAAALLTVLWSALERRPNGYPRLGRWLHFAVRFDLAFWMLSYGLSKFYTGQFGELGLARLTQEIGDTWPMTMVGTFMQSSRPYELFGGAGEVLGGLLLFHRRTALLGAFVTLGVMGNVCALNWLCGVPVKLFSAHLWLYALFLLAPYRHALCALFVRNRPTQPVDLRLPAPRWLGWLLALLGWGWVLATLFLAHVHGSEPRPWMKGREKSALYGVWTVERMLLDGAEVPLTDATRWRFFAIDRGTLAWSRDATGQQLYFDFAWDPATGVAQVKPRVGGQELQAMPWTCVEGRKTVPVDPPLLLRNEQRGKPVDGERRTLVLTGQWRDRQLELHTVEKRFRLQTGFRLRQELPDFW